MTHQQAAIYGLGDQIGYPQWYQDAMGYLFVQLRACGAKLYGLWPTTPNQWLQDEQLLRYEYEQSQSLTDDGQYFLGLPLDEENQPGLTMLRLETWLKKVLTDFCT